MATQRINLVEDNTAPPILLSLEREGVSIDVTGCTIELILAHGNTITNTGHQGCTIVTAASGIVQYTPQTGDFSEPGSYTADVKITYANSSVEILYDQVKFKARRRLQ